MRRAFPSVLRAAEAALRAPHDGIPVALPAAALLLAGCTQGSGPGGLALQALQGDTGAPSTLQADVACGPKTIDASARGRYFTCVVELGGTGRSASEIDVDTVALQVVDPFQSPKLGPVDTQLDDVDADGVPDLTVEFDRDVLVSWFSDDGAMRLVVSGKLEDGTPFAGGDDGVSIENITAGMEAASH